MFGRGRLYRALEGTIASGVHILVSEPADGQDPRGLRNVVDCEFKQDRCSCNEIDEDNYFQQSI